MTQVFTGDDQVGATGTLAPAARIPQQAAPPQTASPQAATSRLATRPAPGGGHALTPAVAPPLGPPTGPVLGPIGTSGPGGSGALGSPGGPDGPAGFGGSAGGQTLGREPVLSPGMTAGKGVRRIRCIGCSRETLPRHNAGAPLCPRCSDVLASAGSSLIGSLGRPGLPRSTRGARWLRRRPALD